MSSLPLSTAATTSAASVSSTALSSALAAQRLLDRCFAAANVEAFSVQAIDLDQTPARLAPLLSARTGMTAALSRHLGEPIALRVDRQWTDDDRLYRLIALYGAHSRRVAVAGAIAITMAHVPETARQAVADGTDPFGAVLHRLEIAFATHPTAFLQAQAVGWAGQTLQIAPDQPLYGRNVRLELAGGVELAEVVEFLAPSL